MKIFYLPDLGEGLAEAEIREWYVKVGDVVKVDQPLVSMETAKALVDVPSPYAGKITRLHGDAGSIIQTGAPFIEFEGQGNEHKADKGTVVGNLQESSTVLTEDAIIGSPKRQKNAVIKAMPAVRALAKELQVDLATIEPTGANGQITADDVKNAAPAKTKSASKEKKGNVETLHGVRRAMAIAMQQSHTEIVPVTVVDIADVTHFTKETDITVCILQAMAAAAKAEPSLNAWYDGKTMERCLIAEINIGLAIDSDEGLFVPVLKNVEKQSAKILRTMINDFKKSVKARNVAPADLHGATITLSNFGMIAGLYATPIIVPPQVAILGVGKIHEAVVAYQGKMEIRRQLPLSLTIDHRAVTGGEATRYLAAVIKNLYPSPAA